MFSQFYYIDVFSQELIPEVSWFHLKDILFNNKTWQGGWN